MWDWKERSGAAEREVGVNLLEAVCETDCHTGRGYGCGEVVKTEGHMDGY